MHEARGRASMALFDTPEWCGSMIAPAFPHPHLQFRTHMKTNEAASEFARTKTLAQQRRFLPVYSVREEMLQVLVPVGSRRRGS